MGRERQKKKNRSSISKARPRDNRTKSGKTKVNFLGNEIIAKNWDRKLTLSQNYKRLGLSAKLNGASGGTEKKKNSDGVIQQQTRDSLATTAPRASARRGPQEVQVERDPETGRILRVIRQDPEEDDNPLNDPLNDLMDEEEDEPTQKHTTAVVAQLEAQAAHEAELESKKRPRQQSQREEEWIGRLVEKHQDDIQAMVRDKKLNPMQQTAGDIARRIKKWKSKQGETT